MKNSFFNRIFRPKKLAAFQKEVAKNKRILGFYPIFLESLRNATSLQQLLRIHQDSWVQGFQNKNLGPCEWGMFRTKYIPGMTMDEVYMGGIWGLSTHNLTFWASAEISKETMAGNGFGIDENTLIYDLIMQQYRRHLRSNFDAIASNARTFLLSNKIYEV